MLNAFRTNDVMFGKWSEEMKYLARSIDKSNFKADYKPKIIYDPTWPIGTKITFKSGVTGIVCKAKPSYTVRDGKSLLLDIGHYSRDYWADLGDSEHEVVGVEVPDLKVPEQYLSTCNVEFKDMPFEVQEAARKMGKSKFLYYSTTLYKSWVEPSQDESGFCSYTKYRLKSPLFGKRTLDIDGYSGVVNEELLNGCYKIKYDDPERQRCYGELEQSRVDVERLVKTYESKSKSKFPIGCEVTVYDRYRFCGPIIGKVKSVSTHDGVYEVDFWNPSRLEYDSSLFHKEQCRVSARDILKNALTPEQFRELQKCDVRREVLESGIQDVAILLNCLFKWTDSPQGFGYWCNVYDRLKAYDNMTMVKI